MQGELHRWYENCEMRTIVLSDDSGHGSLDPLWFPGGNQLQREGAIRSNLTVGQCLVACGLFACMLFSRHKCLCLRQGQYVETWTHVPIASLLTST